MVGRGQWSFSVGWDSSGEGLTKVIFEQSPEVGDKGQAFLVTRGGMCVTEERGVGPDMWVGDGKPVCLEQGE